MVPSPTSLLWKDWGGGGWRGERGRGEPVQFADTLMPVLDTLGGGDT